MLDQPTPAWQLFVCGSSKQQQIPIWIFDDEILGAPRLFFQSLAEGDTGGLKLKKQQLDLVCCRDGHRCRQQFLPIADRRLDPWSLDIPQVEPRRVASDLCIVGRFAVTEYKRKSQLLTEKFA